VPESPQRRDERAALVAAAVALTVVLLVAFALVGLSARSGVPVDGPDGGDASRAPGVGTAIAVLCVLAAGLVVRYVLYLIVARTPPPAHADPRSTARWRNSAGVWGRHRRHPS
jgi:hypothetical protein